MATTIVDGSKLRFDKFLTAVDLNTRVPDVAEQYDQVTRLVINFTSCVRNATFRLIRVTLY